MNYIDKIEESAGKPVKLDTPIEALGLDSLELVQLLLDLDIPTEKALDLLTVEDLLREAR